MKCLKSASQEGIDAISVDVESSFTKGLPSFSIVGMANVAIQESKERIKSALLTNEFKFPPKRITVNLSPSEVSKKGSHMDLPIALSIALQESKVTFDGYYLFGELGLDGKLKDTKSIFVLILAMLKQGVLKKVLIPKESVSKISLIPNIEIYAVDTLNEAIEFFQSDIKKQNSRVLNKNYTYEHININNEKYYFSKEYPLDFAEIKGQSLAKKGALISAAGDHNLLMEGSPGCGKTMISKRLQYIMSPMSLEEILDVAKLESIEGKEPDFIPIRKMKAPHHSGSKASITGGTTIGEVALANHGVLFFDELPHYQKSVLESLREPLEDHEISISRVNSKIKYPTKFVFIAAQNPCPCGNLLTQLKECRCSDLEIQRYKNKISDPLLDRIDLFVTMNEVKKEDRYDISSLELHAKVIEAFKLQKLRGQKSLNGKLDDIEIKKYCVLKKDAQEILESSIERFQLSFRGINKILKVSRTIADLDSSEFILKKHIIEALSFRKR
jgi:magnesium chelatase family protein